jgi:transcription elongation regulator 1
MLIQGLKLSFNSFLHRSSFSDFAQKHGKDERFRNIEKMRERESLFNEYLLDVRKREKEEKVMRREQVRLLWTYYLRQPSVKDRPMLAIVLTAEYC